MWGGVMIEGYGEVEMVAWISTEERLPEVGRVVAVIYAPSALVQLVRVAHFVDDFDGTKYWQMHGDPGGSVTKQTDGIVAWCPLPPIPKGA
jgi:hypothetical protein